MKVSKYVAERIPRKGHRDFRFDYFCTGGPGGQNQNKVHSGVRITDTITGLSAEGRNQRDQPQNKIAAFYRLVNKLIKFYQEEEKALIIRSPLEVIKTYNEQRNTVLDHRTRHSYNMKSTLEGKMDKMIEETLIYEAGHLEPTI